MNLQLINPFELQYPTEVEDWLEDSHCKLVRFNHFGTMLALGGTEGRCAILDFDTRSILRELNGHSGKVTSISWSKNGRYLLSADQDGLAIFWDLVQGQPKHELQLTTGGILMGAMHPRNSYLFALCPQGELPFLVYVKHDKVQRIPLDLHYQPQSDQNGLSAKLKGGRGNADTGTAQQAGNDEHGEIDLGSQCTFNTLAFDRSGRRLFLGSTRGLLVLYNLRRGRVELAQQITNSNIRHIRFSRRGTDLLVNSNDRTIRLFIYDSGDEQRKLTKRAQHPAGTAGVSPRPDAVHDKTGLKAIVPMLTFIHKYQDQVNRVQWNECCFTCDGEHVIGGSAHKAEHNIYVWDKSTTNLEKMLTGPKEQLLDLTWHPFRPVAVSVSVFGNIYIWGSKHREDWRNWNAFAPDFKELEENVEYVEREDEFDVTIDDRPVDHNSTRAPDAPVKVSTPSDEEVDITTVEKFNPFNDSDWGDSSDDEGIPLTPGNSSERYKLVDDQDEEEVPFLSVKLAPSLEDEGGEENGYPSNPDEELDVIGEELAQEINDVEGESVVDVTAIVSPTAAHTVEDTAHIHPDSPELETAPVATQANDHKYESSASFPTTPDLASRNQSPKRPRLV
ncbi:chromatin binding protein [Dispira simplex]|nr:chromatin binding protein [Dispira simplex]